MSRFPRYLHLMQLARAWSRHHLTDGAGAWGPHGCFDY